jgi:hypothetical protein
MDAADVFLMYCAIKAHFSRDKYDYHKFGGKTKTKRDSFYKRKDRFFFARLARKYKTKEDIESYLVSNYVACKGGYVGKFDDEVYKDWKRRTQSLSYTFINEIRPYTESFEELFEWDNTHPLLLREYLGKRVSMETMIILDELTHFQKNWDDNDIIWKDIKKLMNKYKKFLTINKNKCKVELINLMR